MALATPQFRKVLPPSEFLFIDVPVSHSMFRTLYDVPNVTRRYRPLTTGTTNTSENDQRPATLGRPVAT